MIVAVVGNPFDGLEIYGPFEDHEDATDWCEKSYCGWWNIVDVKIVNDHLDCPLDDGSGNVMEKILDLCQEHGMESDVLNELQCIEDNGYRSS